MTIPFLPKEPVSTKHEDKIYLVTHRNLSNGYQTAQTAHAIAELLIQRPDIASEWYLTSNSLVVLTAEDEKQLHHLKTAAETAGIHTVSFREPDLLDELTAVAFCPSSSTRKILSNLPLAGNRTMPQEALTAREKRLKTLAYRMYDCPQTEGQNVLQHGRSVREHYLTLVQHLRGQVDLNGSNNWVIPEWLNSYKEEFLSAIPDDYIMDRYLTLHDCGKPFVRVVDEDGKHHFPDHANQSADTYREVFAEEADEIVEYLIRHDMDVHMLSAVEVPEFAKSPHAAAQLLAGLAELTSNAAMFGGIESVGFKMKYKKLNQRGKALVQILFNS